MLEYDERPYWSTPDFTARTAYRSEARIVVNVFVHGFDEFLNGGKYTERFNKAYTPGFREEIESRVYRHRGLPRDVIAEKLFKESEYLLDLLVYLDAEEIREKMNVTG